MLSSTLVDDSDIHRDLMVQALESEGAKVVTAANGQEALQLLHERPAAFDLIMMDMQMPVMNGFTATRLIRERLKLRDLPILALTAGVLPEQQEAAWEAGVSAVITKPVDLDQIAHLVQQWMPARPPAHLAAPRRPSAQTWQPPGAEFPDIAGINRTKAAKLLCGNQRMFLKLLNGFVQHYRDLVSGLRLHLIQGEREIAAHRIHKFCGYAGSIGAMNLVQRARQIEEAIYRENKNLDEMIEVLDQQIRDLIEASAPWREAVSARAEDHQGAMPSPVAVMPLVGG